MKWKWYYWPILACMAFTAGHWSHVAVDRLLTSDAKPDWRPRPEVVVEPYGSKNGTPEPTPIAWTEAEKRIIEAVQKLDAVNAAQNEAIGIIIRTFHRMDPDCVDCPLDDGRTSNTLHAGPKGGFELKARKREGK